VLHAPTISVYFILSPYTKIYLANFIFATVNPTLHEAEIDIYKILKNGSQSKQLSFIFQYGEYLMKSKENV